MLGTVFWDVTQFSLAEDCRRVSETLVTFYHTTKPHISEDDSLETTISVVVQKKEEEKFYPRRLKLLWKWN
jgi:hypothetical protein